MSPLTTLESILLDLQHGPRLIRLSWRYAAMVVLTLALCIGANSAVFTVVRSVLLRLLPVPGAASHPGRPDGGIEVRVSGIADFGLSTADWQPAPVTLHLGFWIIDG
jgi:hypothetical protein